jgi:hypothetical protein
MRKVLAALVVCALTFIPGTTGFAASGGNHGKTVSTAAKACAHAHKGAHGKLKGCGKTVSSIAKTNGKSKGKGKGKKQ